MKTVNTLEISRELETDTQNQLEVLSINNRNPYHDYSDLEKISQRIDELCEDIYREDREIVGIYRNKVKFNPYVYLMKHGMNICYDKEDFYKKKIMSIPTEEETDELIEYKVREKCKFSKNGLPFKRKKNNPVLENDHWIYTCFRPVSHCVTKDVQLIYEICNQFRQVSTGLTHSQRQVIVCDFDEDYKEEDPEKNQKSTYDHLIDLCEENHFPVFTYLEKHLDTNHYQIGWILDEPILLNKYYKVFNGLDYDDISGRDLYKTVLTVMKYKFHSDENFTGWFIKNPNYCNSNLTETIWNNDTVSFEEFLNSVFDIHLEDKDTVTVCETSIFTNERPVDELLQLDSRHMYMLKNLREYVFKFRRENKRFPTLNETVHAASEIEDQSLLVTRKKERRPDCEILKDVKSILSWCQTKYKELDYSPERRQFSHTVMSGYRQMNVIKSHLYHKQKMSLKEISNQLKTTTRSVRYYLKEEVDLEKIYTLKREVETHSDKMTPKMKKYLEDCDEVLSMYMFLD